MKVNFYGRCHGEAESRYVNNCLSSDLETDGFIMNMVINKWNMLFPGTYPLFTTSCTTALETAVGCLGLKQGDEVILPSFNFPSAANAVLLHGGVPVFCDIDQETQNISVRDMARKIGPRTRAVVAVHYAGVSCPMEELLAAAGDAGIALIEDAAQGIGAFYTGRDDQRHALGTMGDFGAISFHHTKNLTCGEGGVLMTGDQKLYEKAGQYRLHGTNRSMYLRGEVDRYTWNMPGSCTAMGELPAAMLVSQLEILERVTLKRREIAQGYRERLTALDKGGTIRLMGIPKYAGYNGHIFYLRFEHERQRNLVREFLLKNGVECRTHYVPLHMSPQGAAMGYKEQDLKESAKCSCTLLRLPIHGLMTMEQVEYTTDMVIRACTGH